MYCKIIENSAKVAKMRKIACFEKSIKHEWCYIMYIENTISVV